MENNKKTRLSGLHYRRPTRKFRGRQWPILEASEGSRSVRLIFLLDFCKRAFNAHYVRIPQLVDVAVVIHGELAVGPANPAAVAVVGAGRALARRPLVAGKARARRCCSVAQALVGALHVVVRSVHKSTHAGVYQCSRLLSDDFFQGHGTDDAVWKVWVTFPFSNASPHNNVVVPGIGFGRVDSCSKYFGMDLGQRIW